MTETAKRRDIAGQFEHSTGPWYVGSEHEDPLTSPHDTAYRYDADGWPFFVGIKETEIGRTDYHVATGIQSEHNARLIASAPDLLELARAFKSYLEDDSRSERRRQACLAEVTAAIAKATQS